MIFVNKAKETVRLLNALKVEKSTLYAGIAFGFASKTLELIKKCVGDKSEQYRLMSTLLYDQTAARMEYTIIPADGLIVSRVKSSAQFDSIINACIDFVKAYGLYKPPSDKKNVFGDLDNAMLWTLVGFIATTSFLAGVVVTNYGLGKLIDPNSNAEKVRIKYPPIQKVGRPKLDLPNKSHSAIKDKPK